MESGGRVSNAWVICLQVRDNFWKRELIPDEVFKRMFEGLKAGTFRGLSLGEKPASHQLVGRVMAYQGLRVAGLRG